MRKTILQEQHPCSVQKNGSKNTQYWRNGKILKIGHLAKAIAHAKAIAFCKIVSLGQKLKMPKRCEKPFYKNSTLVLCKKRLEKAPNIGEKEIFKIDHIAKAIAHAKAIAFCKIVSLGQKLKMPKRCEKPFYKNSTLVLCKKRL